MREGTPMSRHADQSFEFAVAERPRLIVKNPAGSVAVTAGRAGRITVRATKTLRGVFLGGNGLDALERVRVTAEQEDDAIRVAVHQPTTMNGAHLVTVALAIEVPAQCALKLNLDAGNVKITGVTSEISGRIDAGNLTARDVTFLDRSEARVDAGNVTIEGALGEGAALDIRVDAGAVRLTLPRETDAILDASVDAGSIAVAGWNVEQKRELMSARARGPLTAGAHGALRVKVDAGAIRLTAQE
jgi:hypothetical protein